MPRQLARDYRCRGVATSPAVGPYLPGFYLSGCSGWAVPIRCRAGMSRDRPLATAMSATAMAGYAATQASGRAMPTLLLYGYARTFRIDYAASPRLTLFVNHVPIAVTGKIAYARANHNGYHWYRMTLPHRRHVLSNLTR